MIEKDLEMATLLYLIKSKLHFSMFDVHRYIEEKHPSIDIPISRNQYLYLGDIDFDLNALLANFINDEIEKLQDEEYELDIDYLTSHIDVYFDITHDNDYTIIEIVK